MKTSALTSSLAMLLLSTSLAVAQIPADEHAGHHPDGTPAPVTGTAPATTADAAIITPRMQENLKKMQDLMARIRASKDSAERQQLLLQHSKAMHEQMEMMRGMSGAHGGVPSGGMKMGEGLMNQMMMKHQAMQGRMQMMEMMMGQMLEHQEAQQSAKPTK